MGTKKADTAVNVFAQITKVDEAKRTVTGRLAQEVPDHTGQILDYEKSKPHFEKWVKDTQEASGGKSSGNMREMHGNVAAGKFIEVVFNDAEKSIDVTGKVVDDKAWEKVLEGVYTGFSIGGKYVGEPVQDGDLERYVAAPIEGSLVDAPCIPTALFFDINKKDGTTIQKAFKPKDDKKKDDKKAPPAEGSAEEEATETPEEENAEKGLTINGTPEDVDALVKLMTENKLALSTVNKTLGAVVTKNWSTLFDLEASKATFADAKNKRFPLDTTVQIKAAWYYVNQPDALKSYTEDEVKALKGTIGDAWKAKIDATLPVADLDKAVSGAELTKSFYTSAGLCSVLDSMMWAISSVEYQYVDAGEPSMALRLKSVMSDLAKLVVDMIGHDTSKLTTEPDGDEGMVVLMAKKADDLQKATVVDAAVLAKIGARNAKSDQARIQKMHDTTVELLAKCAADNVPEPADDDAAKLAKMSGGDLSKLLTAAVEKATAPLLARIEKMEKMPIPSTILLRSVSKTQDLGKGGEADQGTQVQPVLKSDGQVDEVKTLIKAAHLRGGEPLVK